MTDDPTPQSPPTEDTAEPSVPSTDAPPIWKRLVSAGITIAVLVLVFGFVIPQFSDYRAMADYVGDITPAWWVALGVATIAFLVAYPIVLTTVLRTLRFVEAFVNHMTGTAVTNTLPSGGAFALGLNYTLYLSWGFTPQSVSAGLLAAGVWDWFGRIALPVLAVVAIAIFAEVLPWMWAVSIGGAAWVAFSVWLTVTLLRSESAAQAIARWVDRVAARVAGWLRRDPPAAYDAVLQFRTDLRSVIANRSLPLTATTILNHTAMAALYTVSIYAVGVTTDQIPVPWVVLSFALGRFLVMIPVSPGGLGLVDLGWIGLLTLGWQTTTGEPVDTDLIAAGVLLFRALSLFPPIPLGMGSWVFWRVNSSWRQDWREARRGETTSSGTPALQGPETPTA